MNKRAIVAVLVLSVVALVTPSQAAVISETEIWSGTPSLSDTLTFGQFDDLGGTLTLLSIQVSSSLEGIGGTIILDNDGDDPANGTYEFGAQSSVSSTGVSLLDAASQPVTADLSATHADTFSLGGNDGDGTGDFDPSPADGMQYNGSTENDSDSGFIGSAYFGGYIGTGTYDIDVSATQYYDTGGVGGVEVALTPMNASGDVTIVYTYTEAEVPEPATFVVWSLLGLCFGTAAWRRRRRQAV